MRRFESSRGHQRKSALTSVNGLAGALLYLPPDSTSDPCFPSKLGGDRGYDPHTADVVGPSTGSGGVKKERREFYIPQTRRESSLYGSEFELRLRNKLTQRAIARECAEWIKRKVTFKSNKTALR